MSNCALERIDVFDELYSKLDREPATFDEIHTKGLWHQTFACWLVNKEKNTLVLQLRGPRNLIDPGSFDASAGGHILTGEERDDGFRELEEELGVTIAGDKRSYLGMFRNIAIRGGYINHEFCHVYLVLSEYSLKDFALEEGEVSGAFEVDIDDALALFSGKVNSIKIKSLDEERSLSVEDMCNSYERTEVCKYYLKVILATKALISGEGIIPL